MPTLFTNAYDVTPTLTGQWADVDVSAYCPPGTTGVILELTTTATHAIGLRKKGSTDDRKQDLGAHTFGYIGVDGNRVFQAYLGAAGDKVYLHGYFTSSEAVFFTNGYDKTPTLTGQWVDINCSAEVPEGAVFAIVESQDVGGNYPGLRPDGSTDDRPFTWRYHGWALVPLSAGRVFEYKMDTSGNPRTLHLLGYVNSGKFKVNATEVTPAVGGTWQDIDLSNDPDSQGMAGVLLEMYNPVARWWAMRKKGSTDDIYAIGGNAWQSVGLIAQRRIQAKVGGTDCKLFVRGYLYPAPGATYPGRKAIPYPYVLRYPNPQSGRGNVPIKNGVRFTIKSDSQGIDISTVKVKIVDSQGTNVYDKNSPYFKYSPTFPVSYQYDIEVSPPQAWAYEENVRVEIEAEDLDGTPGIVYEYVPS